MTLQAHTQSSVGQLAYHTVRGGIEYGSEPAIQPPGINLGAVGVHIRVRLELKHV